MRYRRTALAALLTVMALSASSSANVRLPSLVGEGMVLQQGPTARVWGWADAGEPVKVTMAGASVTTKACPGGKWSVDLPLPPAGGPYTVTIAGYNTIVLRDVLVGEVWVCSGQSNMAWPVERVDNAEAEIALANYPGIRLFSVPRLTSQTPWDDVEGAWVRCSPETVPTFSAVGYFFGRCVHLNAHVPVGLINTSWGGTPAEAWTERSWLEANPMYRPALANWDNLMLQYPDAIKTYNEKTIPEWEAAVAKAKAEGKSEPKKPSAPVGPDHPHRPANLYNAMIAPLTPFRIRGAIWYQGEANAPRAWEYRDLMPRMIRCWRDAWDCGDFPFLLVQLANYMAADEQPTMAPWPELREAQLMTLGLTNTGMAVTIDIGNPGDIHPRNKQDVGRRLALWALASCYGQDVECSGPLYESMTVEFDRIRVFFTHVGDGLVSKGGGPLTGFAIAGADGRFVWANAEIEGDTVVVWSDQVPSPVAVRYAWGNNPSCNLYNAAGLPASPFRTDTWKGVTQP